MLEVLLTGGMDMITATLPTDDTTFARFRVSTVGGLGPLGEAPNGDDAEAADVGQHLGGHVTPSDDDEAAHRSLHGTAEGTRPGVTQPGGVRRFRAPRPGRP